uniref:Uncharacterized protein n=1 Tax=Ditylenchus dipsaci TaxID=166011 RepID=A0A915EBZ0_9BILA
MQTQLFALIFIFNILIYGTCELLIPVSYNGNIETVKVDDKASFNDLERSVAIRLKKRLMDIHLQLPAGFDRNNSPFPAGNYQIAYKNNDAPLDILKAVFNNLESYGLESMKEKYTKPEEYYLRYNNYTNSNRLDNNKTLVCQKVTARDWFTLGEKKKHLGKRKSRQDQASTTWLNKKPRGSNAVKIP